MTATGTTSAQTPVSSALDLLAQRRGMMLALAAAPGAGKTTISRAILSRDPKTRLSISATTRAMRAGEVDGEHYYFVDRPRFEEMVAAGDMLEHALVFNNHFYGTPRAPVEKALAEGYDILFDIDWQGVESLKRQAPDDLVSVYILPPSWATLEERLRNRGGSDEDVTRRLSCAVDEISHYGAFDYVIVNNDLTQSIAQVEAIIAAERLRRHRLTALGGFVDTLKP